MKIPERIRALNPLITPESFETLHALREHPQAPHWNHEAGDRIQEEDLTALEAFRKELAAARKQASSAPAPILEWVERLTYQVPSFEKRVPDVADLEKAWSGIGTMCREDIATHPEELVPLDADLFQMIVYRTAGTTGHALWVPHHHRAAATYQVLVEFALERYALRLEPAPDDFAGDFVARTAPHPYETGGEYTIPWHGQSADGTDLGNGAYVIRVEAFDGSARKSATIKAVIWRE